MKTKLHKTLFLGALTLMGAQAINAQTPYAGTPFGGTAAKVGEVVGLTTKIQLEDFDSAGATFPDGFNTGVSAETAGKFGTYWDKSAGNDQGDAVPGTIRPNGDVDITESTDADGNPNVIITGNQGGEYQCFTVEFVKSGDYHANVNYKVFAAGKKYQIFIYTLDNFDAFNKIAFNSFDLDAHLPKSDNGGATGVTYMDSPNGNTFNITAGTYVVLARTLDGGPTYDYISFTLDAELSVDDAQLKANTLTAYPNPAQDGRFNLSIESKWEVYSLLGVKVLKGEGKIIDLSTFAKGAYIVKTPYASKMLISK
tara:strand:- start:1820 stop:2752 length:933 start_codon:yes stop_codon:yes gene_type:complete